MEQHTNEHLIDKICNDNKGYITRKNIDNADISSVFLSRYVKKNGFMKYCAGFYANKTWIKDDYLILQYKHPQLIYSFNSAAYLHGLIDDIPLLLEVTGPKNYRPFHEKNNDVKLHTDTRKEIYEMGIQEVHTIFGNKVNVYDIEKTICDFIRNRKKIDSETFVKCLNNYKKRKDKDRNRLMEYAQRMNIVDDVLSLMEVLLNED